MKLKSMRDVKHFQHAIDKCERRVWLTSETEQYDLKDALSQYVAIGKLISGDSELELFTESKDDERYFLKMFATYPEMV